MKRTTVAFVLGLSAISLLTGNAPGDEPGQTAGVRQGETPVPTATSVDKNQFNLFNPVPRPLLREFQTDRPDQTEGPYTVDAGHVQIELDLVNYTYDRQQPHGQPITSQALTLAPTNFRVGLLNNLEFDLIAFPWVWVRDQNRVLHTSDQRDGIGDATLRLKLNLFGNDEGQVALGFLPFIKLPTNQARLANHYVEGGLIIPLSIKLPDTWELDCMTEADFNRNAYTRGYHAEWINSISLHRDLIKDKLNAYVEYSIDVAHDRHAGPLETGDFGLLIALNKNVQLDVGINIGISRRAPDCNPFTGLSVRF